MKRHTRFALISALVYFFAQILPFVFFGDQWGMVWYPVSLPLSELLKPYLFGLGDAHFYVGIVTALNALGVFAVCYLAFRLLLSPGKK